MMMITVNGLLNVIQSPSLGWRLSLVVKINLKKIRFDTQGSHLLLFTLLVMLGSYEPQCIVTIKMVSM